MCIPWVKKKMQKEKEIKETRILHRSLILHSFYLCEEDFLFLAFIYGRYGSGILCLFVFVVQRMSHFVIECMEIDVFAFLIVNIFHL